ncbi:MAG: ABC transporter ATP-binding protein [Pseudomonadota bacterium]
MSQPTNQKPLLALRDVTRVYRTSEVETAALAGIDLEIDPGEFVAIMGPSGCGKSTLLNILGMLDSPTRGDYEFRGEHVGAYDETRLARLRKRHIGIIFQDFHLIDELSVRENIELALLYQNVSTRERQSRADEVMDQVGIGHRANHRPAQLSGGQRQRVAVARALIVAPDLILADEPTGNLDSAHGEEVMGMLRGLNEQGATIIMVTHSPAHADWAKRTVNLLDGRVIAHDIRQAI